MQQHPLILQISKIRAPDDTVQIIVKTGSNDRNDNGNETFHTIRIINNKKELPFIESRVAGSGTGVFNPYKKISKK